MSAHTLNCFNVAKNNPNSFSHPLPLPVHVVQFRSKIFMLNETALLAFVRYGGMYVYAVSGLPTDAVANPCSSKTSRWIQQAAASSCNSTLDATSQAAFADALDPDGNKLVYALGTTRNDGIRDIDTTTTAFCAADDASAVGAQVGLPDGTCWRHVHPDEQSVFDFTAWSLKHPGNTETNNYITAFADRKEVFLAFPGSHPVSRWEDGDNANYRVLLGRLNDDIDFANLPSSVQSTALALHLGSESTVGDVGFEESCGSPGEVNTIK
jgi:hypothetical protein